MSCDDVVTLTARFGVQQAQNYARMGRVSGQLAPIGGIGGSSVRIAPQLTTVHLLIFFFLLLLPSHFLLCRPLTRLVCCRLALSAATPQPNYRYIPLRDFRRADLELYEKLGSGSFGSVYRCSLNGFTCAVKIMTLGSCPLPCLSLRPPPFFR
jgi:hypothetical protein